MNNTQISTLIILIVGALSGCVEFKSFDTPDIAPCTDSVYESKDISEYLKSHNLTAGFGQLQITLHSDKSVTSGNETGYYIFIGTVDDIWSCAINDIDNVEYLYLHSGRKAVYYNGNESVNGYWFRYV